MSETAHNYTSCDHKNLSNFGCNNCRRCTDLVIEQWRTQSAQIAQLQAENQALRKDAERLDFMQHGECRNLFHIGETWYSRKNAGQPHQKHKSLRDAIDAAIAKEKD